MNALIRRCLDARKRRQEDGEGGFSLIELIVVVAILGILIAIAIPVFSGIQSSAQDNSLKAVAANGANVVAGVIASGKTPAATDLASLQNADIDKVTIEGTPTLENICIKAESTKWSKSKFGGNGANADGSACKTSTP